jgi:RNA polymerase sigma-70 factor (family 1)
MQPTPALYEKFEKLFREQYNQLANYAHTILRSRQDAEDVVQDVFIKLWQKDPTVVMNDGIKFYLLTATKNTCISFLRKQSGKTTIAPEEVALPAVSEDPIKEQPADYQTLVKNALALLPPQCLAIFKLSRFTNLSYRQIADELGLSVKTVENQMGKALKIMREYAKQHKIPLSLFLFLAATAAGNIFWLNQAIA